MINFTTPTITLIVKGVDITAADIYVTLEQMQTTLTKTGAELETEAEENNTVIRMTLTQEESASFEYSSGAAVQVNWITADGTRGATGIKTIGVLRNLLDEVIDYGH